MTSWVSEFYFEKQIAIFLCNWDSAIQMREWDKLNKINLNRKGDHKLITQTIQEANICNYREQTVSGQNLNKFEIASNLSNAKKGR